MNKPLFIEQKIGFEGWFTIQLIDAKTGRIKRELKFKNLITDVGLDFFGASSSGILPVIGSSGYCGLGTGSTTPANSDTTLVAEVSPSSSNRTTSNGGTFDVTGYVAGPPDYHKYVRTYLFLEAQANGNLTEVGIFTAVTSGTMWTRQLLKDSGGTPTTVIKTSSDQLKVIYELRVQPPQSDAVTSVTISGTSYTVSIRGVYVGDPGVGWVEVFTNNTFGGSIGFETNTLVARTTTSNPSGNVASSSTTVAAYVNGNKYRDITYKFEPGIANFATGVGGIFAPAIGNGRYLFQIMFSPKFAKDNTMRLTLIVRVSFDRV